MKPAASARSPTCSRDSRRCRWSGQDEGGSDGGSHRSGMQFAPGSTPGATARYVRHVLGESTANREATRTASRSRVGITQHGGEQTDVSCRWVYPCCKTSPNTAVVNPAKSLPAPSIGRPCQHGTIAPITSRPTRGARDTAILTSCGRKAGATSWTTATKCRPTSLKPNADIAAAPFGPCRSNPLEPLCDAKCNARAARIQAGMRRGKPSNLPRRSQAGQGSEVHPLA